MLRAAHAATSSTTSSLLSVYSPYQGDHQREYTTSLHLVPLALHHDDHDDHILLDPT